MVVVIWYIWLARIRNDMTFNEARCKIENICDIAMIRAWQWNKAKMKCAAGSLYEWTKHIRVILKQ